MVRSRSLTSIAILTAMSATAQNAPEVSASPATAIFRSSTNLVQVPVVVRDASGHEVGTLKAEDFHLFDNGKAQVISKFSVEKFETTAARGKAAQPVEEPAAAIPVARLPDRFVAYLFDDEHMNLPDLVRTRDAARRQIDTLKLSQSGERVGVFTTSGRQMQEFTADLDRLHAAMTAITIGRASAEREMASSMCPKVSYFMGDLVYNKHDGRAKGVLMREATGECGMRPDAAERMVEEASRAAVFTGDNSTESSLSTVRNLISRMAALPGYRSLVVISPGFLVLDDRRFEETKLIDNALASNVVIGGLDARGLYTTAGMDASSHGTPDPIKSQYANQETMVIADVMAELADGTGGRFYHGTNDYDEGFQRVAAPPGYVYLLAFSPDELKKNDKAPHHLKVTLTNPRGFTVQARATYFVDVKPEDPAAQIRQQIQDAFFSNQDVKTLPVQLQAEFFKDGDDATLTANVRVDATKLALRKDEGRNRDDLTMVIGIFDSNGNFMQGFEKTIELRLKDETLGAWLKSGIENSTDFTLKPGKYLVRLVVRDSEGASMAEQSTGVDIPW
jgi:VWFA-related protein